jgi:hypothetical protein
MSGSRFFETFAARSRPPEHQLLRQAVGADGERLRAVLAASAPPELSIEAIRTVVEGNLWMLGPEAFRYFLPAFLHAALEHYDSLSVFASELVGALTEPSREDVLQSLDRDVQIPTSIDIRKADLLRAQQLEWFDSGTPVAIFRERVDGLTDAEGAAVLAFLVAFKDAHGADFPFDELQIAIDRHWARYHSP